MAAARRVTILISIMAQLVVSSDINRSLSTMIPTICNDQKVPDFQIDTARLAVINDVRADNYNNVLLYIQSSECYECDLIALTTVKTNCTVLVDTRWPVRIEIRVINGTNIQNASYNCSEARNTYAFLEKGEYAMYLQRNEILNCNFAPLNTPMDSNIAIYVAVAVGCFLVLVYTLSVKLYRQGYFHRIICFWSTESVMSDFGPPMTVNPVDENRSDLPTEEQSVKKERLRSLDAFRGLSIVVMIFVNYGGGCYWFFRHSKWNGLTLADLVFPWFVYIMGTAMVLSFQSQLRRSVPKLAMFYKIVRRSCILFALGLLINSDGQNDGIDLSNFRVPGVLQRFALTYLIVATLHLLVTRSFDPREYGRLAKVRDLVLFWPEWIVHLLLVGVHTAITFGLSVPGCPKGYLGPGGYAEHSQWVNCTGGAAGYIDHMVFTDSHIYQNPTCKEIYKTVVPYDPEGLLGTITSCFICFLGLQAGKIILIYKDWVQRMWRFLIWGVILGVIAGVLCKFSKEDGWIPINKNLWSLSFVLALASMAFILLATFYLLIDVFKAWNGAPFYYPGMNSIVLYVGHELLAGRFPVSFSVELTHPSQLAMNLWGTCFWVLVAYYLNYKAIYIAV